MAWEISYSDSERASREELKGAYRITSTAYFHDPAGSGLMYKYYFLSVHKSGYKSTTVIRVKDVSANHMSNVIETLDAALTLGLTIENIVNKSGTVYDHANWHDITRNYDIDSNDKVEFFFK